MGGFFQSANSKLGSPSRSLISELPLCEPKTGPCAIIDWWCYNEEQMDYYEDRQISID